jgi:hypothetical protein
MSSINPFSGYVAQGTQIERTEAADKKREARRTQEASQSVTRRDDELEHQVESADAVAGVHDEQQQPSGNPQQQQQQQKKDDDEEEQGRLDVTA